MRKPEVMEPFVTPAEFVEMVKNHGHKISLQTVLQMIEKDDIDHEVAGTITSPEGKEIATQFAIPLWEVDRIVISLYLTN